MIVLVTLLVHASLLAYSATRHSPTLNEPGHLVAGLVQLRFGRFEVYRVNPPLVHFIAALPVAIGGYHEDWTAYHDSAIARPEFRMGSDFIKANGENSVKLFIRARWACLIFSVAGGLFCFLWSREVWQNDLAGLFSLWLWCFEPNLLAHGELISTDAAAASIGTGAVYCFWRWLRQPTWQRTFHAGICLGLAQLTKTTWLLLFGLFPALWLLRALGQRWAANEESALVPARHLWQEATRLFCVMLIALYILNLGYGFDGSFSRLKAFTFSSTPFTGHPKTGTPGNRFAGTWIGELPIPLPKQYLRGLDLQQGDLEHPGQRSYLRGQWKEGGWWYYYLYGLGVKMPHGEQLLLLLSLATVFCLLFTWSGAKSSAGSATGCDRALPDVYDIAAILVPGLTVLAVVSSHLGFNHHVRYVLPVVGSTTVFAGIVSYWFLPSAQKWSWAGNGLALTRAPSRQCAQYLILAALTLTTVSTLSQYPHHLAYFNELAGGPRGGPTHLLHSNVDWGQDLLYAKEVLHTDYNDAGAYLLVNAMYSPEDIGLKSRTCHDNACRGQYPKGLYVVSTTVLEANDLEMAYYRRGLNEVDGTELLRALKAHHAKQAIGESLVVVDLR